MTGTVPAENDANILLLNIKSEVWNYRECVCCSLPHGTMLLTSGFCADSELFSLSLSVSVSLSLSFPFPPSHPYFVSYIP